VEAFALDYFDVVETRDAINMAMAHVGPGVVIAEGMFFLSAPMRSCFDVTIRLEISEQEVMSRALKRDIGVLGSREWVVEHYERQCIPAQRIYRRFVGPDEVCDWLLLFDDGDMDHVSIVKVPEG
jgi:uridine kinase